MYFIYMTYIYNYIYIYYFLLLRSFTSNNYFCRKSKLFICDFSKGVGGLSIGRVGGFEIGWTSLECALLGCN